MTLFSAYLCFHIAEIELHCSGVLSCVFLGLVLNKYKSSISPTIYESLHHFWTIIVYFINTSI